jgi:hypothetical protein
MVSLLIRFLFNLELINEKIPVSITNIYPGGVKTDLLKGVIEAMHSCS